MNRRRFLQIAAACALVPNPGWTQSVRRRIALGAETEIRLHGPRNLIGPAMAEAERLIDRVEELFSLYRPRSALSRLNREGRLSNPPEEMVALLHLSKRLHTATGGVFDPTIQPLWRALVQGRSQEAARRLIGFERVTVSEKWIGLASGQELTLNGIAQGYATDIVTEALARHGLTRALVNIGEHRALGGPFRLGLEDPSAGLLGQITLDNGATAASSPSALTLSGIESHILDPTGTRVPLWSTVSVSARSAAIADGLSTALCLAELEEIQAVTNQLGEAITIRLVDRSGNLVTV